MPLYLVGTPIGNLSDMTPRAIEILKSCSVILVEKWTDSIKLLKHFEIGQKEIINFDERNQRRATPKILTKLEKGEEIALITSAGMPGVSDPGAYLVSACHEKGIIVVPIPGPSALSTAISATGFEGNFLFIGFLPKKKGQIGKIFEEAKENKHNLVFFESTYRLMKTLEFLKSNHPTAKIFIGKEMTKKFEQYKIMTAEEALTLISVDKLFVKGEFTIVVKF